MSKPNTPQLARPLLVNHTTGIRRLGVQIATSNVNSLSQMTVRSMDLDPASGQEKRAEGYALGSLVILVNPKSDAVLTTGEYSTFPLWRRDTFPCLLTECKASAERDWGSCISNDEKSTVWSD